MRSHKVDYASILDESPWRLRTRPRRRPSEPPVRAMAGGEEAERALLTRVIDMRTKAREFHVRQAGTDGSSQYFMAIPLRTAEIPPIATADYSSTASPGQAWQILSCRSPAFVSWLDRRRRFSFFCYRAGWSSTKSNALHEIPRSPFRTCSSIMIQALQRSPANSQMSWQPAPTSTVYIPKASVPQSSHGCCEAGARPPLPPHHRAPR